MDKQTKQQISGRATSSHTISAKSQPSKSKSAENEDIFNVNFVPTNTQYVERIKVHIDKHKEQSTPNQALSTTIGDQFPDPSCLTCHPVPREAPISTEFAAFWNDWCRIIFRPRHYTNITLTMFNKAQEAKDYDHRLPCLILLVQSLRFTKMPEEGFQNILGDITTAWDNSAGFARIDDLNIQTSALNDSR